MWSCGASGTIWFLAQNTEHTWPVIIDFLIVILQIFLASKDALEVMGVTQSVWAVEMVKEVKRSDGLGDVLHMPI